MVAESLREVKIWLPAETLIDMFRGPSISSFHENAEGQANIQISSAALSNKDFG